MKIWVFDDDLDEDLEIKRIRTLAHLIGTKIAHLFDL